MKVTNESYYLFFLLDKFMTIELNFLEKKHTPNIGWREIEAKEKIS